MGLSALHDLGSGLLVALGPEALLAAAVGVLLGTIIGILPGIGPLTGMALLLPFSTHLPTVPALVLIAGIYYGAMYGGSTTAILLNIPGETASVVSCFDGYPMRLQGRAGQALGMTTITSFFGGIVGVFLLAFVSPPLVNIALMFGPPEQFALAAVGLSLTAILTGGRGPMAMGRGLISATFGLFLASVGVDIISGRPRFIFGRHELLGGIDLVVIVLGLFAIGEILAQSADHMPAVPRRWMKLRELLPTRHDMRVTTIPAIRSTGIGFVLGIIPGVGTSIASFVSYGVEKRLHVPGRNGPPFGEGAIQGVGAPEAANNAAAQGSYVPLLALGIPGSGASAVLLGAFILQGIQPGPLLFVQSPDIVWGLIASMLIGNFFLLALNLPLISVFVQILRVPFPVLALATLLLSMIGAYSVKSSQWDVALVILIGYVGFVMQRYRYPLAPVILGVVLGPLLERSFFQSVLIGQGSPAILFSRPIPLGFYAVLIGTAIWSLTRSRSSAGRAARDVDGNAGAGPRSVGEMFDAVAGGDPE